MGQRLQSALVTRKEDGIPMMDNLPLARGFYADLDVEDDVTAPFSIRLPTYRKRRSDP
ncbi:MAG: hypothetical protein AB8G16_15565 [Gammaproteobacteria bacterium]